MSDFLDGRPVSRAPGVLDVCVLFGSVLAFSAFARAIFGGWLWLTYTTTLAFAAASVVMTGLPALALALDRGRGALAAMLLAGGVAGALPPLVLVASGVLRLTAVAGVDAAYSALTQGAVIPGRGIQHWSQFTVMAGATALIGVASGGVVWLVRFITHRRSS